MKHFIFIVSVILFSQNISFAQSRWSFELHGGEVYNVPMPLTIKQQGYPDLKLTARYHTEAPCLYIGIGVSVAGMITNRGNLRQSITNYIWKIQLLKFRNLISRTDLICLW